jgi:AraC-like DNA-binding protein
MPPRQRRIFEVKTAAITVDRPGATYGPRTMVHYEFIWIMDGEATIHFGRQKIHARSGTVLLRQPGVRDYYQWSTKSRTTHAYIHFDLDRRREAEFSWPSVPTHRVVPEYDILRPLMGFIVGLGALPEPELPSLELPALDMLIRAYVSGQVAIAAKVPRTPPDAVSRAVDAILVHTERQGNTALRLGELAKAVNTSPENLCRVFKRSSGLSPLEYAKLVRLDRAAAQMRNTSLSLKLIAGANGFYDAFHLSRSFTKVYGVAPKVFRESERSDWLTMRNPVTRTLLHRGLPRIG